MQESKHFLWRLYRYKVHHVFLWICYFLFWVQLYRQYYPSIWGLIVVTSAYFIFNAAAFYATGYYLFPRFLYRKKYGKFLLWFGVLVIALSLGLGYCLQILFKDVDQVPTDFLSMFQIAFMAIATMVALLGGIKLFTDKIRSDSIRDKQRLEAELQYLKGQVNPHFLFNAINSVYFLIKKDPDSAAETLIRLSDLLRFQLYECSTDSIAIEKEIEYLNNFIALEKTRKGKKVQVNFEQHGSLSGFQIAPFILIPFVENAFKHISNFSNGDNRVCIRIRHEGNLFKAHVENTRDSLIKNGVGGIGLKNVKRRLELLYPEKHKLNIQDNEGKYSVHLSLTVA
jgi:two-component system, LytTR family, sensor kinase